MSEIAQEIIKKALTLPPVERAKLIDNLFSSFDNEKHQRKIDQAWASEAESRIDAFETGRINADSASVVFKRINKTIRTTSA